MICPVAQSAQHIMTTCLADAGVVAHGGFENEVSLNFEFDQRFIGLVLGARGVTVFHIERLCRSSVYVDTAPSCGVATVHVTGPSYGSVHWVKMLVEAVIERKVSSSELENMDRHDEVAWARLSKATAQSMEQLDAGAIETQQQQLHSGNQYSLITIN